MMVLWKPTREYYVWMNRNLQLGLIIDKENKTNSYDWGMTPWVCDVNYGTIEKLTCDEDGWERT